MKTNLVSIAVFHLSLCMAVASYCVLPAPLHADKKKVTVYPRRKPVAQSSVKAAETPSCDCSQAVQAAKTPPAVLAREPAPAAPAYESSDRERVMQFSLAETGEGRGESPKAEPAVVVSKKTPSRERIQKIAVFPTTPFEVYTIYTSLAVFWVVLIGLVIIIKMKLSEIERIQKLGIHKEDINAPLLH